MIVLLLSCPSQLWVQVTHNPHNSWSTGCTFVHEYLESRYGYSWGHGILISWESWMGQCLWINIIKTSLQTLSLMQADRSVDQKYLNHLEMKHVTLTQMK